MTSMLIRCLRSRNIFCSDQTMTSSSMDRSGNGANQETAEAPVRYPSPPPMGSVGQGVFRRFIRRKKRRKVEEISPDLEVDLSLEVEEMDLIDLLTVHRKTEAKELKLRQQLMEVSAQLLSKEEKLMTQLAEVREEKRTCITALGEVLSRIDTCRAHLESTEAELAAARDKKSQDEACRHHSAEKELTKQREDALLNLELERDKYVCQICMNRSRDALVLPCMHFLYCSECLQKHQTARNDCPTCRGPITALLLCKLSPH